MYIDKNHKYCDKIFSAIIYSRIYDSIENISYVKYWQDKYKNFRYIARNFKKNQDIASTIATFIDTISNMNNPNVSDIAKVIIEKLTEYGFIGKQHTQEKSDDTNNIFEQLGISPTQNKKTFTDLEINQFMIKSFQHIYQKLETVCNQFES